MLIPSGSQVVGQLQPTQGGTEFVAQTLTLPNGQQMSIDATSEVITKTEQIKKGANIGTLIKDTALGAAAAAAISGVTGDRRITTGEVLGGAGLGTLAGIFLGRSSVDLIVIDPQTDLNLRLNQPLVIGAQ
ncbi:MAG TPA: hypothetical protein V6D12_07455 [Candidatus Obscuribacterales bacterium]